MQSQEKLVAEDQRRERYEERKKQAGERRVNARFEPDDLARLKALTARYGSEANALRAAVRVAFKALTPQQQALFGHVPKDVGSQEPASPAARRAA